MLNKIKEKMLLVTLEKALKSVNLLKKEEEIIAGYKYALKHANSYLKISLNYLIKNKDDLTEKKIKKELNKYKLNEKIFNNIVKMEKILSKDNDLKILYEEFKTLFKEYKVYFK